MPKPCQKGRCPARADVFDWNTTEYRKGCRRTQCVSAHTLAEQRRRDKKAKETAAAVVVVGVDQLGDAIGAQTDDAPDPDSSDLHLVTRVRADLVELNPDHPLKRTLGGVALALAQEVEFLVRAPTRSAAPAAKQLVEVLERLMPTKKGSLEEELQRLFSDDEDDAAAPAG